MSGAVVIGIDYGGRDRIGIGLVAEGRVLPADTPWSSIGCDRARCDLLDEMERGLGIAIDDDAREGIQTVGDFTRLIERRADA